ncbi:MAG: carboxypeptidase regulatory-like domain-containing protein [Thermoplasmata archaeon]|nr:carboxypeptidase regulatory-like domain-containing protein [Thermoplasmata archaeon]
MVTKAVASITVLGIILLPIISTSGTSFSSWNDDWSFRQEISIPIDTGLDESKFQPIDIKISFDNPCWAENEKKHSIRVVCLHDNKWYELESQIYDLDHTDNSHISSCSLVFLIPEFADGKEKYYVYYDDEEKPEVKYPDHVSVEKAYYYFAPIQMYPFESKYYEIKEDGIIVYGVSLEGQFLGSGTSQQITKFKSGTKQVNSPQDAESWASFDFFYYYGNSNKDFSSTVQKLVSSRIIVDGNLMVKFEIISESKRGDFKTTAVYKYYYSPCNDKRIYVHIKHEATKACRVVPNSPNTDSCGNIAGLQAIRFRSPSVKELNFGELFPYMHVYAENNVIQEYALDTNPQYTPNNIKILGTEDDVDLGENAWASFDEGEKGKAHAIIFHSNNIISSGDDERDGVQTKAFEGALPSILGLEIKGESFYFTRNSYEKGCENDLTIPANFVVEYDAEFFSTERGGYKVVDKEAKLFKSLVRVRPIHTSTLQEQDEKNTHSLTAYIHLAPSTPLGSELSLLSGKNLSYITAELYKGDSLISKGTCERFSLNKLPSFNNGTFLRKIRNILGILDWRNFTILKKICFKNLEPGTYLLKVYKEHPFFNNNRKYIGYKIVNVKEDTTTHIWCSLESSIELTITDQNKKGVKNAIVNLIEDDITVSSSYTLDNGLAILKIPLNVKKTYLLRAIYDGFIISEEKIKLSLLNSAVPLKKRLNISIYTLKLQLKDTWGFDIPYKVNPILTSNDTVYPVAINAKNTSDGTYVFENIYPAEYQLKIQYKSFTLEENLKVNKNQIVDLVFPVEFQTKIDVFDMRGTSLQNTKIIVSRDGKEIEKLKEKQGSIQFYLPPGDYKLTVYSDDKLIGERKLEIIGEQSIELVTIKKPFFPLLSIVGSALLILLGLLFSRGKMKNLLKIFAISLLILSVTSPWWMLQGLSDNGIKVYTSMFLTPISLTTILNGPGLIAGEISSQYLTDTFTTVMLAILIFIIISCLLSAFSILLEKIEKTTLSKVILLAGVIFLVLSLALFYYTFSTMAKMGIGSFLGEGNIEMSIPGEKAASIMYCEWGPSTGFNICLLSVFILMLSFFLDEIKYYYEKFRCKSHNYLLKNRYMRLVNKNFTKR